MNTDLLPVIDLAGPPRERGRIHGETLRSHIREVAERHADYIAEYFGVVPQAYLDRFLAYADFEPTIAALAPDLLDEVQGLAEGAGLSFREALLMQLVDEEWVFGFYNQRPARPRQKCTSFGVVGEAATFAGQNMDVPKFLDGHQVLFRFAAPDGDLQTYVFSYAGLLALNGLNSAGVGVCCNSLNQLEPTVQGLPVAFIVRKLLETTSFRAAEAFLRSVPHASGQNYILAAPGQVGAFEGSASKVVEFKLEGAPGRVCHTNHAMANDDLGSFDRLLASLPEAERPTFENSRRRYLSIFQRLGSAGEEPSLDALKAALSAHDDVQNPVSRTDLDIHGSYIGFTAGSMIYEFRERPRLHLAAGPPCSTAFRTFDFT